MQVSQERLIAAWQPLRALHVDALVQQVKDAMSNAPPADASWIEKLQLAPLDPSRLVAGVEMAISDGRQTALDEARRQHEALPGKADNPATPTARLHAYAQGAERLLAASLVQTASREAFRLTATTDQVSVADACAAVLGETSTRYEQDILQGMATGGVNEGRYHVMEAILGEGATGQLEAATSGQVSSVYALEILDGNTCDPCAEIDGQEYASLAEARVDYPGVGGGYIACAGRERCRGSLVIVYGTEAQSFGDQPPPITSDIPPVPPPPTPPASPAAPPPPNSIEFGKDAFGNAAFDAGETAMTRDDAIAMFHSEALAAQRVRTVVRVRPAPEPLKLVNRVQAAADVEIIGEFWSHEGRLVGQAQRRISFADKAVEHETFGLSEAYQQKGIARDVLRSHVAVYDRLGIDRVTTHAAGENGTYTWPRFGFDLNPGVRTRGQFKGLTEVEAMRESFLSELAFSVRPLAPDELAGSRVVIPGATDEEILAHFPETSATINAAEHAWDFAGIISAENGVAFSGKEQLLEMAFVGLDLTLDLSPGSPGRAVFDAYTRA